MPYTTSQECIDRKGCSNNPPFFSIAIPTYKRNDLLREALDSILAQSFENLEILVGNDCPDEILTNEILGIDDSRVRIVNHPANLREVGNMNALLSIAAGRYFTWLYDDDLFEPGVFQVAHDTLTDSEYPDALFPSYRIVHDTSRPTPLNLPKAKPAEYTGKEFLLSYSATRPDIISTTGFFRLDSIRNIIGRFESLSNTITGLYSEYLMLVRCGLLQRVLFLNTPFVVFRAHAGSWGESNMELERYPELGRELIKRCADELRHPSLCDGMRSILLEICKTHLYTYYHRSVQYELFHNRSKISRALKYRIRYYKEIFSIWKLYAEYTGCSPGDCLPFFLPMATHYHIYPPVWDSPAEASAAP